MTEPIRLRRAFVWDCDECGRENVLRVMEVEVGRKEFNREFGRQYDEYWLLPDVLLCNHCKVMFGDDDELESAE